MTSAAGVPDNESAVPNRLLKRPIWLSITVAILLIVFGMLAILLPVEMSFGVVIVICWLLIFSAIVQVIDAFRGSGVWHTIWKIAVAAAYLITGIYLRMNLGIGLVALTLALIFFFVAQGVVDIVVYFRIRKAGANGWLLLHGIITLLLGLMIWRHWPSGSLWVVGTLVGIHMIITGMTRLMLALAIRRAAKLITQEAS